MRGHIERRGDKWRVTVDLGRDPITNRRRRASRTCDTQREAEAAARELGTQADRGAPVARGRTVGQLIEAWYAHVAPDLSPTTRLGYRSKIDIYLIPELGQLPLRKLTTARVDDLYRTLRKRGHRGKPLSASTVRKVHACLNRACQQAVRWGWLPTNPCTNATPGTVYRPDIEAPTAADVAAVLAKAPRDLRDAIVLAIATGRRRGELCGIRWADVDLDAGTITFRRSVATIDGKPVIVTSTRKSKRTRALDVDPGAIAILRARRRDQAADALAVGKPFGPDAYVLSDVPGAGTPFDPDTITARFRVAARRAKVTMRFHDLRHFHVTELIAAGIENPVVIERAGWSSGQMLDRYAHARAAGGRRAAEVIGNLGLG